MRLATRIIQWLVGLLFIASGLVKLNDPLGLDYKMQEFFELWQAGLTQGHFFARTPLIWLLENLRDLALPFAIAMISLEIVTGIALLIGWKKKAILYLLLLLMIFFTFLTGYAYLSGKFTNCGCFGDCFPITPFTSFVKDLVLLALILFLLFARPYISQFGSRRFQNLLIFSSLLISIGLQIWVLYHLPFFDCLPFKKGNSISEQMKPPPGAQQDSVVMKFIYERRGKRYEFGTENLPADIDSFQFIDRVDRLVRKGNAEPRIKGFVLTDQNGQDLTQLVLSYPEVVLIFAMDDKQFPSWADQLRKLALSASSRQVPIYLVTSDREAFQKRLTAARLDLPILSCDFTVMRTAARTEPTGYLLHESRIVKKLERSRIDEILFK